MKYSVLWSNQRLSGRIEKVCQFWIGKIKDIESKIANLADAERIDKSHQGKMSKLKRALFTCRERLGAASILKCEADSAEQTDKWEFTSEDLQDLYPELVAANGDLLSSDV